MNEIALFDAEPYAVAPPALETLSPGRRRTLRQAAQLAQGIHPLTGRALHVDAAPADNREALGLRCKGCAFRAILTHHDRTYPKCTFPVVLPEDGPIDPASWDLMQRVAHSAATDCRAWWPACTFYKPITPVELTGQAAIFEGGA